MAEGGAVRALLAEFFFKVSTKELEQGKKKTADILGDIKKVAAAFAGGAIAAGIKSFTQETLEEITAIRRGAAELRISTDEFQAMRSAGRALGIDIKWLHFSMERLLVSTELAARGSARQATAMKLAGLETKKANGEHKSASELFLDLAGGLEKIKEPAKQAIVVWDLFGRGGHRLLPMLLVGKQRLQELMETTKKYGQYSKETIALAAQFSVSTETLKAAQTGLKDLMIRTMLPALERGVIKTREWIVWFNELSKRSLIGRATLYALSAVITGIALKMAFAHPYVLALVAGFTALVLVLDDLMVWWNGGKSIFGDALDAIFGKGQSTAMLEKARDLWKQIGANARWAWEEITGKEHDVERVEVDSPDATAYRMHKGRGPNSYRGISHSKFYKNNEEYADKGEGGPMDSVSRSKIGVGNNWHLAGSDAIRDAAKYVWSIGSLNVQVVAPAGTDPKAAGVLAGQAANEELQRQMKSAASVIVKYRK